MAKYTMLLAEYLAKGGQLPASFALVAGFEDLFIGRYCDSEIGFETDELFKIKLEAKANEIMQTYADRIAKITTAWTEYDNPVKVIEENENKTFDAGAQKGSTTELPFNSANVEPNTITNTDAYTNEEERGTTRREHGATYDEAEKRLLFLNREVNTLIQKCLNEFKPLFMGVY